MNIGSIPQCDLLDTVRNEGIVFRIADFTIKLQSPFPEVAINIQKLYTDYPVVGPDSFVDFHMKVISPKGLRRWYHPQVEFYFDGFRPFKPLPQKQAYAMFEWSLNWCIANHMHSYFIVHAAVVEKDGKCIILPAPPGSGKSTLCASLVMSGWRLLSDELALIDSNAENVFPVPRPINLKNASIDIIRDRFPDSIFGPVIKDTAKGTVSHLKPPANSVRLASKPSRPVWIVFPEYQVGSDVVLMKKSKAQTFMGVAKNAFNYTVLRREGFNTLVRLIDSCDCYDFRYSKIDEALETFQLLLESK